MAEIHLVHGWKADPVDVARFMSDAPPEAIEAGLRLVFGGRATNVGFIGRPIAFLPDSEIFASAAIPDSEAARRLREAARAIGLKFAQEDPKLWAVRD